MQNKNYIWDKVFKNGPSKIFKGCLPQILFGPFLDNLTHIYYFQAEAFPQLAMTLTMEMPNQCAKSVQS